MTPPSPPSRCRDEADLRRSGPWENQRPAPGRPAREASIPRQSASLPAECPIQGPRVASAVPIAVRASLATRSARPHSPRRRTRATRPASRHESVTDLSTSPDDERDRGRRSPGSRRPAAYAGGLSGRAPAGSRRSGRREGAPSAPQRRLPRRTSSAAASATSCSARRRRTSTSRPSARPEDVRRLFRNCRIIGRRFRLAHILFAGGKIIEVATFRRDPDAGRRRRCPPDSRAGRWPQSSPLAGAPRAGAPRRATTTPISSSATTTSSASRTRTRSGATSRSTGSSTTSSAARSSTTSAACATSSAASCARSASPTCASARTRSASCARSSSARGSTSGIAPDVYDAMVEQREELAKRGAAARASRRSCACSAAARRIARSTSRGTSACSP